MKSKLITLFLSVVMLTQTAHAMTEPTNIDTNPQNYHCEWVEQSDYPNLQPLEISTIWVKFKNTGTATWYNSGDYPVRLGTSHDRDRNSDFYKHTWPSTNRASNLQESSVAPGEIGKFEFYIKAPEAGKTYQEYFQPVVEGITWMEDYGVFWNITVSGDKVEENNNLSYDNQNGYHAAFESQSPTENIDMAPGEIKLISVKFKNTGSNTWSNSGANPVHLGTDGPRDRQSLFFKHTWLSTNRATNLKENSIYPGQSGTFEFYIQAPSTPGKYTEFFTPVAENLTWIGENGVYWIIQVSGDTENNNNNVSSDFTLSGSVINNNQVNLNWTNYLTSLQTNSSDTISGYKVVRSETSSTPTYPDDWWVYLSDTNTLSYTDTSVEAGHKYYYRIGAYSSSTGVVKYTNSVYLTIPTSTNNNDTSFELNGYSQNNGIHLEWNQYPYSAQTSTGTIDGYKVVRSQTTSQPTYPDNYLVYLSGYNTTDYIDTSVSTDTSYYYRIGAYKNGSVVAYTNYVYITYTGNNNSSSDFVLTTSSQNNGIHLSWNKTDYSNAIGYKVVRSTSNSSPNYPDHYLTYISGVNNLEYVDNSVENGQIYYYRIGAYDGSNILEYTPTKSIEFTGNNSYSNNEINLEADTVSGGIKLNWNTYDQDNISGYKILRSESDSSPTYPDEYYKFISGADSIGYVDSGVKSGHSYYYRLGAYNGTVVSYSNTVHISY